MPASPLFHAVTIPDSAFVTSLARLTTETPGCLAPLGKNPCGPCLLRGGRGCFLRGQHLEGQGVIRVNAGDRSQGAPRGTDTFLCLLVGSDGSWGTLSPSGCGLAPRFSGLPT